MDIIILKSAACLAILMVFYKLFLERLAIHKFKRFYLLGALVVSIVIPFITFIKYVEPTFDVPYFNVDHSIPLDLLPVEEVTIVEPTNYLPIILWSIYGLGVLLFASKFCINLFRIVSKINKNEKQKHSNFISVLLNDLIVPHTFFSYIFLNKIKFEAKAIPQEVLLHEQTHASQKHSIDILFIELFQIVFWFNPLLYFIKKDIKLNHEFLADEAVLKQGIDSSAYQETLLQFTSNANSIPLAHAINYSLIKKRFTIMKTQTSKKAVWLRSLLLIPLLGGLLFSFSGRELIEKEVIPEMKIDSNSLSTTRHTSRSIEIKVFNNGSYEIDGIEATKKTFKEVINKLHQDITPEIRNNIINIHVNSPKEISDKEVWFIYNAVQDYGFHRIVAYNQEVIRSKGNKPFTIENINTNPVLEVKQNPLILILNGKQTTFKNLKEDFINATDGKKSNLRIEATGSIDFEHIKKIMSVISIDYLLEIKLSEQAFIEDKTDYSKVSKQKETNLTVNGIVCNSCTLNLSKNGIKNIILGTTSGDAILSYSIKIPGSPTENIKGNTLNTKALGYLDKSKLGDMVTIFHIKTVKKEKLDNITIILVEKNNKNYSHSPKVVKGEKSTLPPPPPPAAPKVVKQQKSNIPPPPPPPPAPQVKNIKDNKTGYININGESHFYSTQNGVTKYYNRFGNEVDKKGNKLSNTQTAGDKVVKGQKITKVYKDGKVVTKFKKTWEDNDSNLPPPPPPPMSTSDHVIHMAKKGASFYYNGKSISSDKALDIVKKNSEINMSSKTTNGESVVNLSTAPINSSEMRRSKIMQERSQIQQERKQTLQKQKQERVYALQKREVMVKQRKEKATINNSTECLFVHNYLDFSKQNSTFKINCINDYPENKLSIFNRFGKLIYTKEGYDNSWDGKVDKEFADSNGKAKIGTYYYVLNYKAGKESSKGYLYIKNK